MKHSLILFLVVCFFYGCASPFIVKNGKLYSKKVDVSLDMPQSRIWSPIDMIVSKKAQSGFMIATDIPGVFIMIEKFPYDQERIREMENLSKDSLTNQEAGFATGVTILNHEAIQIAGQPGYKLISTHKIHGVVYKTVDFRFHHKEWFYILKFMAPKRHYFEKHLNDFEMVKATFEFGMNSYIKNEIEK